MTDNTITDADREAARILALSLFDGDTNPKRIARAWSEAFARHRLAAVAEKDAEIERLKTANGILEDALQEVGDDYPGSSCQEWCQQQVKQARSALGEPE